MLSIAPQMRILVAVEPADFRKGVDGLAGLCRNVLREDPFSGGVFVFRNRRGTAIKILVYDGQGFWLCQKRLSKGRFQWWPESGVAAVRELEALSFRQVRRQGEEPIFDGLIEAHHYLGYSQPVGEHLKYLVYAGERPVACLAWSSAPWHMGARDRFIGWTPTVRRANLHLLAYNTRFLILPWVRVPHLASHILGQMARRLSADWEALYGHPIYYLETFVDRERFAGTCYRAANWQALGQTTGRGIKDKAHKVTLSIKDVLGYRLRRDFRRRLCEVAA